MTAPMITCLERPKRWRAGHWTQGRAPAPEGASATWLEAGTRVATAMGDVRVDALWPHDRLLTPEGAVLLLGFDVWQGVGRGAAAPVVFSPGALGNVQPLRVAQSQPVLLKLPAGQSYCGQACLMVPALALVNGEDICLRPCKHLSYIRLTLQREAVVFAEGARCAARGGRVARERRSYLALDYAAAVLLMADLRKVGAVANAGLPRPG